MYKLTVSSPTIDRRVGGVALLAFAAALVGGFALVNGLEDGDNPEITLAFLRSSGALYTASGVCLILAGIALLVAVRAVEDPRLLGRVATSSGVIGAALLLVAGGFRVMGNGTLLHIDSLDREWGEAAYLVIHLVGTQGALISAFLAVSFWAIGTAIVRVRSRLIPMITIVLSVFPAAVVLILIFGPLLPLPGEFFVVYIISAIVGIPLWCLAFGIRLLLPEPRGSTAEK